METRLLRDKLERPADIGLDNFHFVLCLVITVWVVIEFNRCMPQNPGGVLPGILCGGVPPDSPNPGTFPGLSRKQ